MNLNSSTYKVPISELDNLGKHLQKIIDGIVTDGLTYIIAEIPNHNNTCELWRISLPDLINLGKLLNLILDKLICKSQQTMTIKITILNELISEINLEKIPGMYKIDLEEIPPVK